MSERPQPSPVQRLLGWLKPLIGLAILAWVASRLPYSDRLEWVPGEGAPVAVSGSIEGDWKADEVGFEPTAGAALPEGLPAELAARLGSEDGGTFTRGDFAAPEADPGESGLSWRPGIPRVFRELDPLGLAAGFGLLFVALACGTARWWRLLAVAGCPTSFGNAFRLTFLGLFFNLVVPAGLTGGDLVKAVLVARETPGRRPEAMISVFVDRVIGLLSLVAITAVVILIEPKFGEVRNAVLVVLAIGVGGMIVYWSPALRRVLGVEALLGKLPMGEKLQRLDEAGALYGRAPLEIVWAVVFSLGNHAFSILSVVVLGGAVGASIPLLEYFAVVPLANIVSAIPISPGGWGTGEAAYHFLFELVGEDGTLGVAVSIVFRLCWAVAGLLGGLFLLLPGQKVDWKHLDDDPAVEGSSAS